MSNKKRVLLIVSGGIAAYKTLELIRRLADHQVECRVVMTQAATNFITPLTFSAISENKVYQDLFDLTDESEMGHIRLSRECDLVVVAPATADLMAKMAHGLADDLASTVLLASDKDIMVVPAMNPEMWGHPATQHNISTLQSRDVQFVGPNAGMMACGEVGSGRMSEPKEILQAILYKLSPKPLIGKHILITSGPTHEAIDPVRYIANRSSGKQGHAIAGALSLAGADVTLVSGPTKLPNPNGVNVIAIQSARDMLQAVETLLEQAKKYDVAIFAAAVADWRPAHEANQKLKKKDKVKNPTIETTTNPDILATVCALKNKRPSLVVGFAAETQSIEENATAKKKRKACDWLLANDVSPESGTFGGDSNKILFLSDTDTVWWPQMSKIGVAEKLVKQISEYFDNNEHC